MGFVNRYVSNRMEKVELYLKYCNHSVKRRKLLNELKVWNTFIKEEEAYEASED